MDSLNTPNRNSTEMHTLLIPAKNNAGIINVITAESKYCQNWIFPRSSITAKFGSEQKCIVFH
jgi:hypothetical protein